MQSPATTKRLGGRFLILLDRGNDPQKTVLYLASLVLKIIKNSESKMDLKDLHDAIMSELGSDINQDSFSFAIDFLYLIAKLDVDEKGRFYAL